MKVRMKWNRLVAAVCFVATCWLAVEAQTPRPVPSPTLPRKNGAAINPGQNPVAAANRAFEQAWLARDRVTLDRLVEPDVTWITPAGVLLDAAQIFTAWPAPATVSTSGEVTQQIYGNQIAVVQIRNGTTHVLRIFVYRPKLGWRLLHTAEAAQAPPATIAINTSGEPAGVLPSQSGVETDCLNPCRVVPFDPLSTNGRAALASWQQMEIAAAARDMKAW